MPFVFQKTDAITFLVDDTTLAFFGRRRVFPLHGLSFGLWLEEVEPTLILGEETFMKTG